MQKLKVSIVLPCKNEEKSLLKLVPELRQVMKEEDIKDFEIIVVDHMSKDETNQVARRMGLTPVMCHGAGLGDVIIKGIEEAKGDIILVMDADGQHPPDAVPKLLKPILEDGADVVIGSRYVKGGSSPYWSLKRRIVSRVACLIALPVTRVKDATSGFFAFRKSILEV